ncbi:hypothetical protein BBO99_00004475 [Phytophthora kernoviae]|uniref:Uncharacterized protein n=2 Tax=Phytophthora kernoviae TaxID=325452 RepID=A0A3R7JTQ1_9STRA|nr:hypothetical protein G195_004500 [Phytophthora kernoviae 00238/432]KAG2525774.1 hypothetical protein JM16_004230 [Phytophthora kernoviae]KAG2527555.1 hypothetical protein JM18_003752 [Phytophthora kernoviae]RLN14079.1 hypothetical protein BBI17_004582 [Phytophthora kernoviae]RLN80441.1 hypothetical protein BBO99_00004475 [Phytophthora kernoviae]
MTADDFTVTGMDVQIDKNSPPIPIEASVVSDSTISSSDRCSSCSSSDTSADALDDDYGAPELSSEDDEPADEEDAQEEDVNHFLRNLDAVYDEMEREYEAQVENEYLENEGMAREEARQRTVETQRKAEAETQAQRGLSPPLSRSSSVMSSSVPTLNLSQKQVLVSPRARSSHDLRFKYLKHLGIDS